MIPKKIAVRSPMWFDWLEEACSFLLESGGYSVAVYFRVGEEPEFVASLRASDLIVLVSRNVFSEFVRKVRELFPDTPILVLCSEEDQNLLEDKIWSSKIPLYKEDFRNRVEEIFAALEAVDLE